MDDTGLPMRKGELIGRAGKQTREAKLATRWSVEGRDAPGVPVLDQGSVTYSAAIESAAISRPFSFASAGGLSRRRACALLRTARYSRTWRAMAGVSARRPIERQEARRRREACDEVRSASVAA